MRIKPSWGIAVLVYIVYNAIIYGTWYANDADYANMVGSDVAFKSIFVPLAFGAVFMAIVITWLGWWRAVMIEDRRGGPGWTQWVLILVMLGVIALNLAATDWSALSMIHLATLAAAGVLVGFNEESLARGVMIVGWRGSTPSEVWVWFWTCLLFGMLHLPNWFFGLGPVAVVQVGFAFLAGSGFYVIRRVGGRLWLCMALHGVWDFANFTKGGSGVETSPAIMPFFQYGTYLLSIALVIVVLLADRRRNRIPDPA